MFDFPAKLKQLNELEEQASASSLWDDPTNAQKLMKALSAIRHEVEDWQTFQTRINDVLELAQLEDESFISDITNEIEAIEKELSQKELHTFLSGKYDRGNALLAIHAGAGGTESQDWAEMLQRMYLRWCERNGYEATIIDLTPGEEAGIKTATISIEGRYAYGNLRSEKGTHRLVRISPYDANARRHTSFAMVEVLPEVDNDDEIIISPDEIKIDTYKSAGAGGQNVQKNATAIRITHLPTNIVVSCQNERSLLQNRENALKVLKSRLLDIKRDEQEEEMAKLRGAYKKAEWGSQIRSYVLHPYQLVKDHRTNHEEGNAHTVLDGNLNPFIEAYLRSQYNQ
ncbi:MAG TPA: peptide chain release factor 2 [Chloroflexi bacterium]|nr:peptide chain release factor 2 [Chloroflexota bacterium]